VILGTGEKIDVKEKNEFGKIVSQINELIAKFEARNLAAEIKASERKRN